MNAIPDLSKASWEALEGKAARIRALGKSCAGTAIEIGKELIAARTILETGTSKDRRFTAWVAREFDWSLRTAYRFIRLAIQFGDADDAKLAHYSLSALYLLAEPSTPESLRDEAEVLAEKTGEVTHRDVQELLKLYQPPLAVEASQGSGLPHQQLARLEEDTARADELRRGVASLHLAMRRLRESHCVKPAILGDLERCLAQCKSVLGRLQRKQSHQRRICVG